MTTSIDALVAQLLREPHPVDLFCRSLRRGAVIMATIRLRDEDRLPPREGLLPFDGETLIVTYCGPVDEVGPRAARASFPSEHTFEPLDKRFPWITSGDLTFRRFPPITSGDLT